MVISKKGEGSSLSTILALAVGLIVVVALVWGFSTQWKFFQGVTNPFSSKSNIDSVKSACGLACSTEDDDEFCNDKKTVRFGEKIEAKSDFSRGTVKIIESGKSYSKLDLTCSEILNSNLPVEFKDKINLDSCSISCTP